MLAPLRTGDGSSGDVLRIRRRFAGGRSEPALVRPVGDIGSDELVHPGPVALEPGVIEQLAPLAALAPVEEALGAVPQADVGVRYKFHGALLHRRERRR